VPWQPNSLGAFLFACTATAISQVAVLLQSSEPAPPPPLTDASKAGPGPKQPPEALSTPRRQLAQPLISTPSRGHAVPAQPSSTPTAAAAVVPRLQQAALGPVPTAQPPQWAPLLASPALGAAKAQGAGLLSVRKGPGQPAPSPGPDPTDSLSSQATPGLTPTALPQPSAGMAGVAGSGSGAPNFSVAERHQQQWEQPRMPAVPPSVQGTGSLAARAAAALKAEEGAGGGSPGGSSLGRNSSTQLQHLSSGKSSGLSVRLQGEAAPMLWLCASSSTWFPLSSAAALGESCSMRDEVSH
jgi:hypothetical protein